MPDAPADYAKPTELAFTARLLPTAGAAGGAVAPKPVAVQPAGSAVPASGDRPSVMADTAAVTALETEPAPIAKPGAEPSRRWEKSVPAAEEHARKAEPAAASWDAGQATDPAPRTESQPVVLPESQSSRAPETAGDGLSAATKVQVATPVPEPVSATSAARDINLQFSRADGLVQVHVTERAGEVRVAVHTPDSNLAGALRQDLPALTAKLEQTGFRAEAWHGPAAASAEGPRTGEPSSGSLQQDTPDSQKRNFGGQQDDQQQGQREAPEKPGAAKPDRKDFSWLFDSLR